MNETRPPRIIWFTASPNTCAARGSRRAASAVTVDFPAAGIPETITHPDNSATIDRDASIEGRDTATAFPARFPEHVSFEVSL